jgi:serine/threonine-protein kinase RIO1
LVDVRVLPSSGSELGAAVPRPFSAADNALLMAFIGDVQQPAPVLHGQTPEKAGQLFHAVLSNVELMPQHGLIHGDLSAYNIRTGNRQSR